MNYNYKEGKQRIIDILDSKTQIQEKDIIPSNESEFTYENGIKTWVGSLFVDIRDSSSYFKDNKSEIVARVMRAFCSEIISILSANSNYRQIGIRGDCVYAIYTASKKSNLKSILEDAITINTFQKMFQKILSQKNMPTFDIGIGMGASEDLIIKAGKKGTGISDNIWIGDSVVNASKLSSIGNKDGFSVLVLDSTFYSNIKGFEDYKNYFNEKYSKLIGENVYHDDVWWKDPKEWIDGGMKNGN
jgi:hypothetical protein